MGTLPWSITLRRYRYSHNGSETALCNFALTFAKALLVFCVVLFLMISPHQQSDGSKPKAEYLITVDWTSNGKYDVDTWTRLPNGRRVNFTNKEAEVVFLERDDLGNDCDTTTNSGRSIHACEEITVVRGIMPGEFVLGLHLYSAFGILTAQPTQPVRVEVKIERLNPTVAIVWQTTAVLNTIRQEKDIVRFSMLPDGRIVEFDTDDLPSFVN